MTTLKKDVFQALSQVEQPFCATIYMPTHQAGEAVLQQADAKALKQQYKILKAQLEKEAMSAIAIESFLLPLENLLDDSEFWRKQAEGLAIFMANGQFEHYALPFAPEPQLFLANKYYLLPLLPLFAEDGHYIVLNLSLEGVRMFRGSRYTFNEEDIAAYVPKNIETVAGSDYEPRHTQVRSVPAMQQGASYHGYGEGKDDRKTEIANYMREVEKGISKKLNGEIAPLVLTGTDYLIAMYKHANSYLHLYTESLPGNQQHTEMEELHQRTWELVAPHFSASKLEHRERFLQFQDTPQTSTDIGEILPAAIYGKVEALFIRKNSDVWGIYDPAKAKVEIDAGPGRANTSLSELAAVQTFLQGGQVYMSAPEEMPYEEAKICALYRY